MVLASRRDEGAYPLRYVTEEQRRRQRRPARRWVAYFSDRLLTPSIDVFKNLGAPDLANSYRIGVIGHTGRGGYGHGVDTTWFEHPQCKVVAVSDPDPEGLAKARDRLKVQSTFYDYRKMDVSTEGIGEAESINDPKTKLRHYVAIESLLSAIEDQHQPDCSVYDGRGATEMITSVFESHRINGPVALPLSNRQNPLKMLE